MYVRTCVLRRRVHSRSFSIVRRTDGRTDGRTESVVAAAAAAVSRRPSRCPSVLLTIICMPRRVLPYEREGGGGEGELLVVKYSKEAAVVNVEANQTHTRALKSERQTIELKKRKYLSEKRLKVKKTLLPQTHNNNKQKFGKRKRQECSLILIIEYLCFLHDTKYCYT